MSRYHRDNLRGHAEPVLRGRPLFIRFCEAFVDNLSLILKVALVIGAISFAKQLHNSPEPASTETIALEQEASEEIVAPVEGETWKSPGVLHALNCTYTDYREQHYDECVKDASEVYKRPGADPDDTSFIPRDDVLLYAGLNDDASPTSAFLE